MKKYTSIIITILLVIMLTAFIKKQKEPWNEDQLMAPADLAAIINGSTNPKPLIIDIGPSGLIKDAINTGPANEKENLKKLKTLLSKEKKDRQIVIYCGCCPFQKCPNIRPAFSLLNSMKFTNHKLLNLSTNLKTDWINYGYPMNH
jgi:thiosulfate/3-mercaptopyruvate sulfurtransferase